MTNDSKQIFAKLKPMVEASINGCKKCGGSGKVPAWPENYQVDVLRGREIPECPHCGRPFIFHSAGRTAAPQGICMVDCVIPCPTCAKWRAMVKVVCWHEPPTKEMRESWPFGPNPIPSCPICGLNLSGHRCPDLTTSRRGGRLLLVAMMDGMGLLDDFLKWHSHQPYFRQELLDGKYLVPAVKKFLEGRGC
ncbi:hypothetical protein LCGC14_0702410 [marine sediment metagenome]|uniref:Uncharacterized protein n=1 Tax=marine sediment metagenome TaxID=412755 RepID=A0A0F9TQ60_9ZZZZ